MEATEPLAWVVLLRDPAPEYPRNPVIIGPFMDRKEAEVRADAELEAEIEGQVVEDRPSRYAVSVVPLQAPRGVLESTWEIS